MPISQADLTRLGNVAIAAYQRNPPVDQVTHAHPFYDTLEAKKQDMPGSWDGTVKQVRVSNTTGTGQGIYAGDDVVSYGRIDSVNKLKFNYINVHDGFTLTEDDLRGAGIQFQRTESDSINSSKVTADEEVSLTNLMKEQVTVLGESMKQKLTRVFLLDGTQAVGAVPGLDAFVSLTPTVGTIGGFDRATRIYWRNYAKTGLVGGNIGNGGNMVAEMEKAWRNCQRIGKQAPTHIRCGETYYDALREFYKLNVTAGIGAVDHIHIKMGTDDIYFHNVLVEIDWDFVDMDTLQNPTVPWAKRCYFLNMNHIKLNPVKGSWWLNRTPARPVNQYVTSWAITCSFYLTIDQMNCHAVLALA